MPTEALQRGRPAAATRRTWRNTLAALVLGALGLSSWALMHGGERHVVSGTVLLTDSALSDLSPGDQCSGSSGYGDIDAGTSVVLTDGAGATMSTAVLSAGRFDGMGCVFSFVLRDVQHSNFYGLAVAGSNRGQLHYSYSQLSDDDWSVQLSLGDS